MQSRRRGINPCVKKVPWKWQPTPIFFLGNPMDRGAWWATVHRVTCVGHGSDYSTTTILLSMRQFMSTYESVPYASWNISCICFIIFLAVTKILDILLYFLSIFFVCIDMYFENRLCWIPFLEIYYFYIHIISIFVLCQMFFHSFIFHGLVIIARSKQFCDYPTAGHVNCPHSFYTINCAAVISLEIHLFLSSRLLF